jgi:hypothetical protein
MNEYLQGSWMSYPERGPYGTNLGDIWSAEDSSVGQRIKNEHGGVLIHEMLRVDGKLDERIYWVEENNSDAQIQDLIKRARDGTELYLAAQAQKN